TIQFAFVVTKKHRQPAPLLVVEKLHHFRQIVHLYGDSQLIFGLPGVIKESLSMSEEKLGQHYLAALNEAFPGVVLDHAWQTKD
ncbi:hypothetical protein IBK32_24055, partial [Escherichia coli]|nr:hypothetical protein [Escherichia coli]